MNMVENSFVEFMRAGILNSDSQDKLISGDFDYGLPVAR